MAYIYKGIFAGVVAALVLAAGMQLASQIAIFQPLDFVTILGNATRTGPIGGFILHCLIGAVWGGAFAFLDPDLPGDNLRQRGVILSLAISALMLVFFLPAIGGGMLGMKISLFAPLYVMMAHIAFGAVMGGFYAWLFVQALPIRYRLSGWSRTLPLR